MSKEDSELPFAKSTNFFELQIQVFAEWLHLRKAQAIETPRRIGCLRIRKSVPSAADICGYTQHGPIAGGQIDVRRSQHTERRIVRVGEAELEQAIAEDFQTSQINHRWHHRA